MSAKALNWAWSQPVADPLAKLLLVKLADQANDDGVCWPSRRTLAADCGLSVRSVVYKGKLLASEGLLEIRPRSRENGSRSSNVYVLRITPPVHDVHPPRAPGDTPPVHAGAPPEPPLEPPDEPFSEPNGSAQNLVAYFVDRSRASGSDPPKRVKGQLARLVGEMLSEGIEPARVQTGIDLILERGLHPSVLPSAVHEASLRPGARASPRVTGWRFVRGTHGTTYVQDPEGTDIPPRGYA